MLNLATRNPDYMEILPNVERSKPQQRVFTNAPLK
jgi:hypothetical protein